MEIIDNRKRRVYFQDIKIGDIFDWHNCIYIKIQSTQEYNGVSLNNGKLLSFELADVVNFIPNCKLILGE